MNYHIVQQIKSRIKRKLILNYTYAKHGTTNNNIKLKLIKINYFTFHNPFRDSFLESRIINNIQD